MVRTLVCYFLFSFVVLTSGGTLSATGQRVVVTIAPLHSLASMVMQGTAKPQLLIKSNVSPHDFAMRPSHARLLASADVIIRVGDTLEGFLKRPIRALSKTVKVIEITKIPGIILLPYERDQHATHGHTHSGHSHEHHGEAAIDPHVWLDIGNASLIVKAIAFNLSRYNPESAAVYSRNASRAVRDLAKLRSEISEKLNPVKGKGFLVFHDGYKYFWKDFGLRELGVITLNSSGQIGARRFGRMRYLIREKGIRCVFSEPQYPPRIVSTLVRDTAARVGILDPLGAQITPGIEHYPALVRNLAQNLVSCLK